MSEPTPTPTPTPTPAPTPSPTPSPTPGAFDFAAHGVAGDDLGYVQNKGFKGPADMVTAYRNLESFVGDRESLIRLPKERTPENMRKDVWSRLGWSDKVEDYEKVIVAPENDKSGFNQVAAAWGHELGIPVETMKALAGKFNEFGANLLKTTNESTTAAHRDELLAYQKESGVTWDDKLKLVDTVAQTFEMSGEEVAGLKAAIGPVKAIKFLERIGAKLGTEGPLVGSDDPGSANFKMTPAAAAQRIKELSADPSWSTRFLSGDSEARRESERLHKLAYPEG